MKKLAREVGEAARVLEHELPARHVKPTRSNLLIETAKRLQRLQTRAAKLRKELKAALHDIRAAKRDLKALAREIGRGD